MEEWTLFPVPMIAVFHEEEQKKEESATPRNERYAEKVPLPTVYFMKPRI